jgi:glucan biosynthesis protein C
MIAFRTQTNGIDEPSGVPKGKFSIKRTDNVAPNVNSVRGVACLLVVALHVVGDTGSNGLHLPMTSNWHYAMQSLDFVRIPLFTALSGYLYAGHRVTSDTLSRFWAKKLRRLAAPLVFATIVMWWLHNRVLADHTSVVRALLFEYGHLWYLQALLILFAGISISDAFLRPSLVGVVLTGLLAIMISQMGITVTTFFGISGAFYLAPYFLFGIVLRERSEWLREPQLGVLALGIILIVLTCQQFGMLGLANEVTVLQFPAALAGMAGVVFLLQRFPSNRLLAHIGHYSYTIYLWHILAGAAVRDVLVKAGITAIPILFLLSLTAAVSIPIVLYHIARRIPLLSVAVTGERWLWANRKPAQVLHGSPLEAS